MFASIIMGALISLVHGFVSITLKANQVVSGLALTMLGLGISGLWGKPYIGKPLAIKMNAVKIPVLGDIPYVGDIFFNQDPYFYLSVFWVLPHGFFFLKQEAELL